MGCSLNSQKASYQKTIRLHLLFSFDDLEELKTSMNFLVIDHWLNKLLVQPISSGSLFI